MVQSVSSFLSSEIDADPCSEPGTVLGIRDIAVTKAEMLPAFLKLAISPRGGGHLTNKWTNSSTCSGDLL